MIRLLAGDCRDVLATLPADSVHCCVTSPPYFGLRDYGVTGQIGLEPSPAEYVAELVAVFREVRRVLRDDGTLWLNLGDSYAGSWGAQGHRITESDDPSWHSSQIKNHPKRSNTGSIRSAGVKPKDLLGIPWLVAFALRADGWWLRQDIIWSKPNPMPESVRDRCTKAHEYLFLLTKAERYYFDAAAIAENSITEDPRRPYTSEGAWQLDGRPAEQAEHQLGRSSSKPRTIKMPDGWDTGAGGHGSYHREGREKGKTHVADVPWEKRNKRSVWTVATAPFSEAHFATFPPALIEPCILAGCPVGGSVLDPFAGAGTTGLAADRLQRDAVLIELNPDYCQMAETRITDDAPLFAEVAA